MGLCCCKGKADGGVPNDAQAQAHTQAQAQATKAVDPRVVDRLVLEMLGLMASFVDNDEESPFSLVKLHEIADSSEGWIQVVQSLVNVIPLEDPSGPSAITIMLDDCPLPSKDTVIKVTQLFDLSSERSTAAEMNVQVERNICVVLGCIAEKLAGPNSVAVLTQGTLEYLLTLLTSCDEPNVVLFALIALEKFAHTTENKLSIKAGLGAAGGTHPLLALERRRGGGDPEAGAEDYVWRQVAFCAQWALDNLFIIEGRQLSYETVDMTNVHAILNSQDVSEYLKISCDGLEARCDSYSFESVRCTFQVDNGCWYYECTIITPGVMQIGWATRNSHYLNYEGYGIGDDLYSLSYDGCRRLVWHRARPSLAPGVSPWRPGDILGCLIDLDKRELVFSINGKRLPPCVDIFANSWRGFFAAASFMAFQQCRFNFGHSPFRHPPLDRQFQCFNDHGFLHDEQKQVIPRRLVLEELRTAAVRDDCCTLCFDEVACCQLEPCKHRGFCSVCTSQLRECPMCRGRIDRVRQVSASGSQGPPPLPPS